MPCGQDCTGDCCGCKYHTGCCTNPLPSKLFMILAGEDAVTVELDFNASDCMWTGSWVSNCGSTITACLFCQNSGFDPLCGGYLMKWNCGDDTCCGDGIFAGENLTCTCDPFFLHWETVSFFGSFACNINCLNGTSMWEVTVTE